MKLSWCLPHFLQAMLTRRRHRRHTTSPTNNSINEASPPQSPIHPPSPIPPVLYASPIAPQDFATLTAHKRLQAKLRKSRKNKKKSVHWGPIETTFFDANEPTHLLTYESFPPFRPRQSLFRSSQTPHEFNYWFQMQRQPLCRPVPRPIIKPASDFDAEMMFRNMCRMVLLADQRLELSCEQLSFATGADGFEWLLADEEARLRGARLSTSSLRRGSFVGIGRRRRSCTGRLRKHRRVASV